MIKSCLVRLRPGDKLLYGETKVEFLDSVLAPNGINDPKIVSILYVRRDNGNTVSATSDKFELCEDEVYEEWYPTPHHDTLK